MSETLRELFYSHEGRLVHKWDHYFDVYERLFSRYRGESVTMLEIGVSHGGSLQLWRRYFGPQAKIYAIDVNPECAKLQEPGTRIFIGSQADPEFLRSVAGELPELDIVLDDGGHTMQQQLTSMRELFPKVRAGGLYVVEDTHTSYWPAFGGGLRRAGTFIEYSKELIDSLHDHHIGDAQKLVVNDISRNIGSIAFHDSMVVFEKHLRPEPFHIRRGDETVTPLAPPLHRPPLMQRIRNRLGVGGDAASSSFGRHEKGGR